MPTAASLRAPGAFRTFGAVEITTLTISQPSTAETGGQSTVLNASGYVTARRRATVASRITGRLTEVAVEEGLPVESGQMLARLDDTFLKKIVQQALLKILKQKVLRLQYSRGGRNFVLALVNTPI